MNILRGLCCVLILGHALSALAWGQSSIRDQTATMVKIAQDFEFTEGPAWDGEFLYFTDQPNNQIWRWSKKDGARSFLKPCGRSNGLVVDHDGGLLTCADEKNQLWKISPEKKIEVLVDGFEKRLLDGPNDLWLDPKGGIYFTDPFYRRPYWTREKSEQDGSHVYYLDPDRKSLKRVAAGFERPNGIIGTPDGRTLYVGDNKADKTYRFEIDIHSGHLFNRRLFVPHGSDGMTLDDQGNVYLTKDAILVFDRKGDAVDRIEVAERPSNVCFGGKTLYITARTSVYSLEMKVGEASTRLVKPTPGLQVEERFEDPKDEGLFCDYLLYLPRDYQEKDSHPLMLFLHGRGESYGPLDIVKTWGPPKRVESNRSLPYILVSPQCPGNDFWSSSKQTKILSRLLDHVEKEYAVDKRRIYLTGLSMGGFGTWALAAQEPSRFAAIAPICGGGKPEYAEPIKDLPIWIWHGLNDRVVPPSKSQEMVEALKGVGAKNVIYTQLEGIGHASWAAAYASLDLYAWFDRQRK